LVDIWVIAIASRFFAAELRYKKVSKKNAEFSGVIK